jgi:hypothetical protein
MLSDQESPKIVAGWIELDYFRRPRRPRRLRFWSIIAALIATMVVVAVISLPRSRAVYQARPISTAHAFFEDSCDKCHQAPFQTARRLWTANEQIRSVDDSTCLTCHEAPAHHEEAKETLTCVNCHREHRGRIRLAAVADKQCTFCHGDLQTRTGQSRFHRNIHAFAGDHPDFKIPENKARTRFNHKKHLELRKNASRGFQTEFDKLQKQSCVYCHELGPTRDDGRAQIDLEQRYPLPINYDRHCAGCHPLRAGLAGGPDRDASWAEARKEFADRPLRHPRTGETAEVVRNELRGRLLQVSARHPNLGSTQATTAGSAIPRLPDRPLPPSTGVKSESWPEQQLRASERELFDGAGGCRYCHIERSETRGPGLLPDYQPPQIPTRWFTHSRFSHPRHRALECTQCHDMRTSETTHDVRMPDIASCQSCHSPSGGVSSDCTLCHTYHDRSRSKDLLGSFTIEELKGSKQETGTVYQEIRSWLKSILP